MTDYVKAAVLGTDEYHATMRQAAVTGLQRLAGQTAQTLDTSNDLFQHTLDGSVVLIETDIEVWLTGWCRAMDNIINSLQGDMVNWERLKKWNRRRCYLESILNRANIQRTPPFWEYVFSQVGGADYLPPLDIPDLPEYPRNYSELYALYDKYSQVQP